MNTLVLATLLAFLLAFLASVVELAFICDEAHHRFRCDDGDCVTLTEKCDFKEDCRDGSDEKDCDHKPCAARFFTCKNGKCIHQTWVCDGRDDCFDRSDEDPANCTRSTCPKNKFRCQGSTQCLPKSFKCDGEIDCPHEDDEEDCECASHKFTCADGRCIDEDYRCDGEEDCRDSSDEQNCDNVVCHDSEFSCASGNQCIQETGRCDGFSDCADESDERNCTREQICLDGYFSCKRIRQCIPMSWKCDGYRECRDGSDEEDCNSNRKTECPKGERLCANQRECVDKRKFCDGNRDCIDKSDEDECPERPSTDCPHETHYKCPGEDGKCIHESQLCNKYSDCPGKEDERQGPHFCDFNECATSNGNCSQNCHDRSLGYECSCRPGFKLMEDGRSCEDINECLNSNSSLSPCDQFCFNTDGSFKCSCWEGYQLFDERYCKATTAENEVTLLVADRNKIENITLHGERSFHAVVTGIHVKSIAVDIQHDFVYWADARSEKIFRANLFNSKESEVILDKSVVRTPIRLALDWVHGLLFWVDMAYKSISVSKLDGSNARTLFKTETTPISLAVHPSMGYMYAGYMLPSTRLGKIERCGMDGDRSSCTDIATEHVSYPLDMAIDYDQDLLYWVDGVLDILVVTDLNGNDRRNTIIETHTPLSLAVYSGRVYFTDSTNRQLVSADRDGSDIKVIKEKLSAQTDIAVLNKQEQREAEDHCSKMSCNWLCVPKSGARQHACLCPDHYATQNDENGTIVCIPTATTSTTKSPAKTTSSSTSTSKTKSPAATESRTSPTGTSTSTVQVAASSAMSKGVKTILIIGIIGLLALVVLLSVFVVRWRKKRSVRMSMNFNNPIYKKVNQSIASNSSFPGLNTDGSPGASAGDVSNSGTEEPGASLILNEEIPDGSEPDLQTSVRFATGTKYAKIPNGEMEIQYHQSSESTQ